EVVQRGFCTVEHLRAELAAAPKHGQAVVRAAIDEVAGGARSAPEAEARELFARSRIVPTVVWNRKLLAADGSWLPTPDGWIEDVGIAIEIDSREHHATPD